MLNLAIDSLFGIVPVIGDVFDVAFKANRSNLRLLEQRWAAGRASSRDWAVVAGAIALFIIALAIPIWLITLAVARLR